MDHCKLAPAAVENKTNANIVFDRSWRASLEGLSNSLFLLRGGTPWISFEDHPDEIVHWNLLSWKQFYTHLQKLIVKDYLSLKQGHPQEPHSGQALGARHSQKAFFLFGQSSCALHDLGIYNIYLYLNSFN